MARFIASGVTRSSRAMSGMAVVMMVESSCSIRNAKATISGISTRRVRLAMTG